MNNSPLIQVAIVEDHVIVREGIVKILNEVDWLNVCIEAQDGRDLINKITYAPSVPDICLLDINMPEMDGFETMQLLNKRWPKLKCIVLTMYNARDVILRMLKYGARGFVNKNCNSKILLDAIVKVHNEEYYFPTLVLKKDHDMSPQKMKAYSKKALSERQIEFLSLVCSDLTYEEIAQRMGISLRTSQNYGFRLCEKIGIHSREGLVMFSFYVGIGKIYKVIE